MFRYILICFAIYFAYKFIFELIIPIYKTTKQVKKQFDSARQNAAHGFGKTAQPKEEEKVRNSAVDKGDYIEFEEM